MQVRYGRQIEALCRYVSCVGFSENRDFRGGAETKPGNDQGQVKALVSRWASALLRGLRAQGTPGPATDSLPALAAFAGP